eukprot:snap_masked-scaffold_10-processed-gene-12.47-mRNA-1 protein AED:1.00 eAED:1.00 QI:0/0/0/0/1/1/2/0/80
MSIDARVAIESLIAVDSIYKCLPGPLNSKAQHILDSKVGFSRVGIDPIRISLSKILRLPEELREQEVGTAIVESSTSSNE